MHGLLERIGTGPCVADAPQKSRGTAAQEEDAIDAASESIRHRGGKNRSDNRAIDHDGADDKALPGKTAGEIAGAIGADKIEQRGSAFDALGDQACEVAHVAIGGRHIRKAGTSHRLRAALADREYRECAQLRKAPMASNRRRRVGAGDDDRRKRFGGDLGILDQLDAQERRNDDGVTASPQRRCSPFRVGFGPGHQQPHFQARTKKSTLARSRNSRPAAAPSSAAISRRPSRETSNASLPSGFTMMPRKRTVAASTRAWPPIGVRQEPVQHGEEGALGGKRDRGIGVVDRLDEGARPGIVRARFDPDRALADRRKEGVEVKNFRRRRQKPETLEAGDGQERRVDFAGVELAQARLHVAAQHDRRQVRPQSLDQRLTARRRGADDGAMRQLAQRLGFAADEGVASVLARQETGQNEARGQYCREILRRVHGKIDGAGKQGFLDFLGEEPFATGIGELAVLNDVAGGANDLNLDPVGVDLGRCGEAVLHFAGLKQRKRGTACTNAQ